MSHIMQDKHDCPACPSPRRPQKRPSHLDALWLNVEHLENIAVQQNVGCVLQHESIEGPAGRGLRNLTP